MTNLLLSFFFADVIGIHPAVFVISLLVGMIVSGAACFFISRQIINNKIGNAKNYVQSIIDDAVAEAKTLKKEYVLEAKEEVLRLKTEYERQTKERKNEMQKQELRLLQKEESLDKKDEAATKKLETLEKQQQGLNQQQSDLIKKQQELDKFNEKMVQQLERVAQMTSEQAKQVLIDSLTNEARKDAAVIVRRIENDAREEGEKKAREIVTTAIQRCASDQVSEATVTTVSLPDDEMKGRLIGREGRNIRAIETATGVELIIDDTPEIVILSGFDPIRRQIARITIEKLIADGRIHPARIEEVVEKVRKEMDVIMKEASEAASFDTGVFGLHPEIMKLLGRLKYRTSYGQNVLGHSIEVAHLSGIMAAELGLDIALAKRAGLLHDIGKAVDHEVEGSHAQIGAELAKKYRESPEIVNAILSHHGDVEPLTAESVLAAAADAISSARPGARRETLQNYVKRLEKLEEIANSFEGVQKCYAIQAGREVRIIVKPEIVNEETSILLAKDIAKRIENELEYPGQIKINVIRETRSVEYAK